MRYPSKPAEPPKALQGIFHTTYLRWRCDSPVASTVIAELSLALAGFSGVAAAFSGRDRELIPIDRGRLDAIFMFSGASLAVSLLVVKLADAGLSDARAYSFACATSGFLVLGIFYRQVPKAMKRRRDGESTTSGAFISFAFVSLFSATCAVSRVLAASRSLTRRCSGRT